MTTIVTRAGKGSPLTNNEVDTNFTNLNTAKIETLTSTDTSVTITGTGSSRDLSVPVNPNVVSGPASATDNAVARFDTTTGKLVQNSVVTVDDTGVVAGASISGASNTLSNIGNAALTNSAITINGASTSLGGSISVGTVTSVTGTAPVVSSGGATPAISMAAANTTTNGYLTSTDWNTFNGKSNTTGTVTSVDLTASTGISVSGGPITGSGSITVTNTAPDQTVALTGGTGVTTSGTYPNFTIAIAQAVTTTSSVQFGSFGVGTAASGTTGEIRATNNVTAYYSDERLKTKVGSIENALDKVNQIETMVYHANETAVALGYDASIIEVGVTAQSVQKVMPQTVAPAPIDDRYLTVRYERLVPLLIEAIKELSAEVKELKAKVQ